MADPLKSFLEFMKVRENAASAYVSGNAAPLDQLATHTSPATFFGPAGDLVKGSAEVNSRYASDAAQFASGHTHLEILHMDASDNVAYWIGLQRASVLLAGREDAVEFNLRVTEVFRLEGNEWMMIHRHADQLKAASRQQSS